MKKTAVLLTTLIFTVLGAEPLQLKQWKDTVIKRPVTFEGDRMNLTVNDGKQTTYFNKAFPGRKGEKFIMTVKVSGKGMLDAGFFGYNEKGNFLGRFPRVLPRHTVDSQTVLTLNYQFENTTDAATIRPLLLIRKGKLQLLEAKFTKVDKFPEPAKLTNHLDTTRKMEGEILPVFTYPNLLKESFEKKSLPQWKISGGKARIENNELILNITGRHGRVVAVSPGITPRKPGSYLLTALYSSQNLKFGSSAVISMVKSSELSRYLARFNQPAIHSSFSGNEIYNRRLNDWQRVGSSHNISGKEQNELYHLVIVFQGPQAELRYSGVYFGLGPWNPDNRKAEYNWNTVVNNLDPLMPETEALDILSKRQNVNAELKFLKGSPRVMINGKEQVPLFYLGDANRSQRSKLQDFRDVNINIQMVFADKNVWAGNRQYRFEILDELMMDALRRNPHGNLIPVLSLSPYPAWGEEFPSEVAVDINGKATVSRHGRKSPPCYWSEVYRKQATDYLRAAVEHMKTRPYFKAVAGVFITGNEDGQFYYQIYSDGRLGDADSPAALPAFRKFLRERYSNNEKLLQKAWKDPAATFATATPSAASLSIKGNFFNPAIDMRLIDTIRFLNENHGDFVNRMCKTVKDAAGKKLLCVMWFGRGASQLVYPHFSQTEKILPASGLDLMGAQPGYRGERHAGCSSFFSEVFDSLRIHNKMTVCEADYRTWTGFLLSLQHDIFNVRYWSRHDLTGAVWREAGKLLSIGGGLWFYDMCGGYFKSPGIMSDIAKLYRAAEKLSANPAPFAPSEMILVADENNFYHTTEQLNIHNGPNYRTIRKTQRALMRAGLQYDFYYFNDLMANRTGDHKLYVFMNLFYLNDQQRKFINSLKRDGKTLVFLYAPGYLSDRGVSVKDMSELTGINIESSDVRMKNSVFCSSPLTKNIAGLPAGIGNNMSGESFCIRDKKAIPLMHYTQSKEVSGAYRDFGTHKVFYFAAPSPFTPEFLQQLAKFAGVHVFNQTPGDMFVQRRNDLAVLHGVEGNENILDYPQGTELSDLITGEKLIRNNGKFILRLIPGETRLLKVNKAVPATPLPDKLDIAAIENAAKELKFTKPLKIMWLGDSLSDLNREHNFIAIVQNAVNKYHPGMLTICNFGVRGDYITRIVRRINGIKGAPPAWRQEMYDKLFAEKYDMMICFLGHNDTRLDTKKSPDKAILVSPDAQKTAYRQLSEIMENFDPSMEQVIFSSSASDGDKCRSNAEITRKKGRHVVLFGDEKTMQQYNSITAEIARKLKIRFVDIDTPMRKRPDRPELFADGVHLSEKGNLYMAWELINFLKQH